MAGSLPSNRAIQAFEAGLPMRFERNVGQADASARYLARGRGFRLLFGDRDLRIEHGASIHFAGASPETRVEALDAQTTHVNDYTGGPAHWASEIPTWSRVRYRAVYPGVDLLFYGRGSVLEYDARVAAGADPSRIRFAFDRGAMPSLQENGDLRIPAASGFVVWHRPVAYQTIAGQRVPVQAGFVLHGGRVGFRVGAFDHSRELVIDPTLSFSTYLGTSGGDAGRGIAVDASGSVYIAGNVGAGDLTGISSASYQSDYTGDNTGSAQSAFIARLNSTGTAVLYITYFGGSTGEQGATSLALDPSGNAYIAGYTTATDFPVSSGAYQTKYSGGGAVSGNIELRSTGDAFVAKFDASGKRVWATFLGGSLDDGASSIALDASGNVYVAGATLSSNFPTTGGVVQSSFKGAGGQTTPQQTGFVSFDTGDGFIAELDPTGAHLMASTYLGGAFDDAILSLILDSKGNVWVGGATDSSDFPLAGSPFQSHFGGQGDTNTQLVLRTGDGFIAELSADLKKLTWSTYLGGAADDIVGAVAVDASGAVYAAGATNSHDFPATQGSFVGNTANDPTPPYFIGDAFIVKLQPGAASLSWSTLLSGNRDDGADAIALDGKGNVIVGGMTDSSNFPIISGALQSSFGGRGGEFNNMGDAFVAILNAGTGTPSFSTFLGGADVDWLLGLTTDGAGNIYVTGKTISQNYPTTAGVLQAKLRDNNKPYGEGDVFVTKIAVSAQTGGGPVVTSVKNAASYVTNAYSPGEYVAIFGSGLGPSPAAFGTVSNGKLSTNVGGVQVTVNGTLAPLGYVSATQINALIPYEVTTGTTVNLVVSYNGASSAPAPLTIAATVPGLISSNSSGSGQAAAYNYDVATGKSTLNSSTNAATVGNVLIIFGTGEGQLTPAGVTGQIATAPTPKIAANVSVTIGNVPIDAKNIQYKGEIGNNVEGAYQLNILVPAGLPIGNDEVLVTIGSATTQKGVTVAIK